MAISSDEKAYLGNINVKVETPDIEISTRKELRRFRQIMREAHEEGVKEGRYILEEILSEPKYYDTGTLFESVASRLFIRSEDVYSGSIHFNNPGKEYAYFVEHGRGKGLPPPVEKMREWGERKHITYEHAMAIRNKIARDGTKPRPFMDRAERKIQESYNEIVARALDRFSRSKT